jgi:hypothetical protein
MVASTGGCTMCHQRETAPYQLLDHAKSRYQVLDHGKSSVDACTKSLEYAK